MRQLMTLTEFEEKVRKSGDTVELDETLLIDLVSVMSLITQTADAFALSDQIENEKARNAYNRAVDNVSDFVSMFLRKEGVTEV